MRILLFLATNLAVIIVASVTLRLLGFDGYLNEQGLDLNALLVFAAIFGFGGAFVSLLLSKWMAKRSTGTVIIEQPANAQERWLMETVAELAREAKIGMPEVGIFPAKQANAFATGWNKNAALVAVSQGLLNRFTKEEARAVLAHEVGHVANGDMVTLTLIQGVVNTFVIFFARIIGSFVDRAIFKNESGHGMGFFIATIAAELVLGILASIIVMWFSRWREFRADAASAGLVGNSAMVAALNRLRAESEAPDQMPDTMKAFGINMGQRGGLAALFSSHPPLEDRIAALQQGR
ncbi:protease HtpX [Hydrocarboniclastica marina]|uniref:Protease HtpX n=1 Tax=Hydrocarboniclastica marina TaxID=2259620 RepID=A0A4P7XG17_9ALTE|nr:protease HtpX [Hydrocarboniclastica marina]MAL98607.1 protease HtpX [Alteromonadaceae bacterium]QCF25645.1 protease HtpX [Hydrocarboniclastica marina]